MTTTPIQTWPARKYSGKPGYSAGHFAALAGASEDPLRVAERIARQRDGERAAAETRARIDAGEPFSVAIEWQTRRIGELAQETWERLCGSFSEVIAILESVPQTPVIRRMVRDAKRAAR